MTMISKTVAERTAAGQRQSVEEQGALPMQSRTILTADHAYTLTG